jgi:hypothetical protein
MLGPTYGYRLFKDAVSVDPNIASIDRVIGEWHIVENLTGRRYNLIALTLWVRAEVKYQELQSDLSCGQHSNRTPSCQSLYVVVMLMNWK